MWPSWGCSTWFPPNRVSFCVPISSVQLLSHVRLFATHELQLARLPCPSPSPGVHSNSRPLSRWCHLAISSSVVPFSSCPQSLAASESFPVSQLFAWGGQSIGVSALASYLTPLHKIASCLIYYACNLHLFLVARMYAPKSRSLCQFICWCISGVRNSLSVQFSHSFMCDSLRPHKLQHTRPPCPSSTPGVYPNSCLLSRWCHPIISSCRPLLLLPPIPPSIRVFPNESTLHMRWPKYWSFSFSISPSKEHPGLISFRTDWLDLLVVQGTLRSLLQHHSSKASFFGPHLSSQSNSHIHTWPLEKPQPWLDGPLLAK